MMHRSRVYLPEIKMFWLLALGLAFLAVFYVYLVQSSVFNIVEIRTTAEQITVLESEVAQLEASFMALSSKINLDLAYELGFQDSATVMKFVEPAPGRLSLAGTNDEI